MLFKATHENFGNVPSYFMTVTFDQSTEDIDLYDFLKTYRELHPQGRKFLSRDCTFDVIRLLDDSIYRILVNLANIGSAGRHVVFIEPDSEYVEEFSMVMSKLEELIDLRLPIFESINNYVDYTPTQKYIQDRLRERCN